MIKFESMVLTLHNAYPNYQALFRLMEKPVT